MPLPLACRVSPEKSAYRLMGVPLYVTSCFYLDAFNVVSLSLSFDILIIMCLDVGLFGFLLFGTLGLLELDVSFLPQVKETFSHYFFK